MLLSFVNRPYDEDVWDLLGRCTVIIRRDESMCCAWIQQKILPEGSSKKRFDRQIERCVGEVGG